MRLDGKILAAPKWVIFFSIKNSFPVSWFLNQTGLCLQNLKAYNFWVVFCSEDLIGRFFFPVKHPGQRNSGHPWNPTVVQEFLQCTPGGFDSFWMVFWGKILRNFAQGKQKNLPPPTPKKWVWLHLLSSPKKMVTFNFYSAKSGKMQGEASLG